MHNIYPRYKLNTTGTSQAVTLGYAKDETGGLIERFLNPELHGVTNKEEIKEEDVVEYIFMHAQFGFYSAKSVAEALQGNNYRRKYEAKLVSIICERRGLTNEACVSYYLNRYVPDQTIAQWFSLFLQGKNPPVPAKGFKGELPWDFVLRERPGSLSVELNFNKSLNQTVTEGPNEKVSELIREYDFDALGIRSWSVLTDPNKPIKGGNRYAGKARVQST
uniref:Uncharacterized protein n=1 Tax=Vitivirus alphactinidiae TaxID=1112769 RepID=A0A510I1C3_9VIRU|nr:hypothetical protein [Actinidia virus A]